MSESAKPNYFPIRKVTEQTGVGGSTLRAWERRYGLLKPRRTPKGHRLYSDDDVRLIRQVLELLDDGHSISAVARRLLDGNEQQIELADPSSELYADHQAPLQWGEYLERMMTAIGEFSPQRLDAVYNQASSLYPLDLVSEYLIEPCLKALGERWQQRDIGIAEEHFFTAWLRNKLGARLHHESSKSSGATVVVACVPGHSHEIGILLFSLGALGRGYRVVYLGPDMPLAPLPEVLDRCAAKGIVLAGGREPDVDDTLEGLSNLCAEVSCPVFVGGAICHHADDALTALGALPIGDQLAPALHMVTARLPVHGHRADSSDLLQ